MGKSGDIRAFFAPKGGAAAKPAAGVQADGGGGAAAEQPAAQPKPAAEPAAAAAAGAAGQGEGSKPIKRTPMRGAGSGKSPAGKSPASAKSGGEGGSKGGSGGKAGGSKAAAKPAAKRKAKQVIDDDSDWEEEKEEEQAGADSDFEIDLVSSGEEEEAASGRKGGKGKGKAPPKKKTKPSPAPSQQQQQQTPAEQPAAKRAKTATPGGSKKKGKAAGPLAGLADNPEALAAVAAVDEAVKKLPGEESLGLHFMSETGGLRAPDEPPNWGKKPAPRGHPDCLTGKTFVVSGVLDSMKREEAEDYVKRHGGKVTGNVSGRTSFLVVGRYAGRTKYFTAKEKNVAVIDEDGLFSLVAAAPAPEGMDVEEAAPEDSWDAAALAAAEAVEQQQAGEVQQAVKQEQQAGAGTAARAFYGGGAGAAPRPAGGAVAAAAAAGVGPSRQPSECQQLWVEKWRPKTTAELVGNNSLVALLKHWLASWEQVHLHGGAPTVPPSYRGKMKPEDLKKRAVLLSGPPGIGKTSSALIVCRELGFEPIEVNASDARGKSDASALKGVGGKLSNAIKEMSTNTAVSYDKKGQRKKLCLIMDEVDGMSGGDRGGVGDLIATIKASKVPIITICNDKYSTKLKSLRNHTIELDFRKPTVQQIGKRMMEICKAEGLTVNQATLDALIQSASGGDIRLILGQLQMIRLRAKSLTYDQVKAGGMGTAKDLEMSPFEAARRLLSFEAENLSLTDQMELVFQDFDLVPLLVQENYLNHRPKLGQNDAQRLRIIAKAADGFSAGDVATRSIRRDQNWSIMPFAAVMGTVYPGTYMRGNRETFGLYPNEPNFPRFTAWLGQNSSSNKQKRLLGELHTRMLSSGGIECDRTAVRLNYLPVLRNTLTRPLVSKGKEGVPLVLAQMHDYCISREDIDFITDVTKFKTKGAWGEDPMKAVETQVKSAFTRAFNQQHVKPRTGFGMDDKVKKKRGGKGRAKAADDDDEDVFGGEGLVQEEASPAKSSEGAEGAEEEQDLDELDPVALQKKLKAMKHKGLDITLKDGSSAKAGGGRGGRGGGRGRGGAAGRGSGGGRGGGRGRGKK